MFKRFYVCTITMTICFLTNSLMAQTIEPKPDGDGAPIRPEMGLINDVKVALDEAVDDDGVEEANASKWIGLLCGEVDPAVRMQIKIEDGTGLVVNEVIDDSPASKAGLQKYDILTAVDGAAVTSTADLVDHVNDAGEQGIELSYLRKGEPMQVVVDPEPRPEGEKLNNQFRFRGNANDNDMNRLKDWFEKAQQGAGKKGQRPFGFRMMGPEMPWQGGMKMEQFQQQMPNNLSVQITRNGNEPANISIQRGDDKWQVTEDNLDQLPHDVRPFVENMVAGNGVGIGVGRIPNINNQGLPKHLEKMMEDMPWPRMNQEFDRLQDQMDRMFKELHELKEMQPQPEIDDDDTIDA